MQFAVSVHQRHPFDPQFLTSEFVTIDFFGRGTETIILPRKEAVTATEEILIII